MENQIVRSVIFFTPFITLKIVFGLFLSCPANKVYIFVTKSCALCVQGSTFIENDSTPYCQCNTPFGAWNQSSNTCICPYAPDGGVYSYSYFYYNLSCIPCPMNVNVSNNECECAQYQKGTSAFVYNGTAFCVCAPLSMNQSYTLSTNSCALCNATFDQNTGICLCENASNSWALDPSCQTSQQVCTRKCNFVNENGICQWCGGSVIYETGCTCKKNQIFNATILLCECIQNYSMLENGSCEVCPANAAWWAAPWNATCNCTDNQSFNSVSNTCPIFCNQPNVLINNNTGCVPCPLGSVFENTSACLCAHGIWNDSNGQCACGMNLTRSGTYCICQQDFAINFMSGNCNLCDSQIATLFPGTASENSTCLCDNYTMNWNYSTSCTTTYTCNGIILVNRLCKRCPGIASSNQEYCNCGEANYSLDDNGTCSCSQSLSFISSNLSCICTSPHITLGNGSCQKCPVNSTFLTNISCNCTHGQWIPQNNSCPSCIQPQIWLENSSCVSCPENSTYLNNTQCVCKYGIFNDSSGLCICGVNQIKSGIYCFCQQGFASNGNSCMQCNSSISNLNQGTNVTNSTCVCDNYTMNWNSSSLCNVLLNCSGIITTNSSCLSCPGKISPNLEHCSCGQANFSSQNNGSCICPPNFTFIPLSCIPTCPLPNITLFDNSCVTCPPNSTYQSPTLCACNSGIWNYINNTCPSCVSPNILLLNGSCIPCPLGSSFGNSNLCICVSGTWDDQSGVCSSNNSLSTVDIVCIAAGGAAVLILIVVVVVCVVRGRKCCRGKEEDDVTLIEAPPSYTNEPVKQSQPK